MCVCVCLREWCLFAKYSVNLVNTLLCLWIKEKGRVRCLFLASNSESDPHLKMLIDIVQACVCVCNVLVIRTNNCRILHVKFQIVCVLQKSTEVINKIPTIMLSISYKGVKFIDAKSKVSVYIYIYTCFLIHTTL